MDDALVTVGGRSFQVQAAEATGITRGAPSGRRKNWGEGVIYKGKL